MFTKAVIDCLEKDTAKLASICRQHVIWTLIDHSLSYITHNTHADVWESVVENILWYIWADKPVNGDYIMNSLAESGNRLVTIWQRILDDWHFWVTDSWRFFFLFSKMTCHHGRGSGLLPFRHQAIISNNVDLLWIGFQKHIQVKFESIYCELLSWKCVLKFRLQHGGHYISASMS